MVISTQPRIDRFAEGRAERNQVPRAAHRGWTPQPGRRDPIDILTEQDESRLAELVPVKYGRMMVSPFTFYRGSAAVMANDLQSLPRTNINVQLCGDAHLSNVGIFATPERNLVLDLNDFDETLPGPWEWDIKRMAASFVIAARDRGFKDNEARDAVLALAATYRNTVRTMSTWRHLDVWYARADVDRIIALLPAAQRRRVTASVAVARTRDHLQVLKKMTTVLDGHRMIVEEPPLIVRGGPDAVERVNSLLAQYRESIEEDRRTLLDRYRFVDVALKVVGVGSVGTRAYVVLLQGNDATTDPLFLQAKQANRSVLEPFVARSTHDNQGQRVVVGQRLMQAASDLFLGWIRNPEGIDFYLRQLRDMKWSVDLEAIKPVGLRFYGQICGWTLARAHSRSGSGAAIAGYLGNSDRFDQALFQFARDYADQAERDHAALVAAVRSGRVAAESGL